MKLYGNGSSDADECFTQNKGANNLVLPVRWSGAEAEGGAESC